MVLKKLAPFLAKDEASRLAARLSSRQIMDQIIEHYVHIGEALRAMSKKIA